MSDKDETVATRLWRDRAQIREQERDDARARLRIAQEKVAILMAESARLRALLKPDKGRNRSETEKQMAELRGALMPLIGSPPPTH